MKEKRRRGDKRPEKKDHVGTFGRELRNQVRKLKGRRFGELKRHSAIGDPSTEKRLDDAKPVQDWRNLRLLCYLRLAR